MIGSSLHIILGYSFFLRLILKISVLLTNASFEREPSGLPFDWRFGKGKNALAEIVRAGEEQTNHVLHIAMTDGRVQFPEISQTILLKPGRYRFEGKLRGTIDGETRIALAAALFVRGRAHSFRNGNADGPMAAMALV